MIGARSSGRPAFTLVESMAAVGVLSILASIASWLILDSVDRCMNAVTQAQLHAELSVAMDRITREIRMIDLDTAASGVAPDITAVTPSFMQWEDVDGQDYWLNYASGEVTLQVKDGPLALLVGDVTSCVISTYDQDNNPLAAIPVDFDPIRRVQVEMTLTRNGISESLRTKAMIRTTMEGDT